MRVECNFVFFFVDKTLMVVAAVPKPDDKIGREEQEDNGFD